MNEHEQDAIRATGGCLCGAVRFEIRGEVLSVSIAIAVNVVAFMDM